MDDDLIYEDCAICNRHVEQYNYVDDGYEFHSRNRKVLISHEDNHNIDLPETKIHSTICVDCLNNQQKMNLFIKQARLGWYVDQVKAFEKRRGNDKITIKTLEKDIIGCGLVITKLKELQKKVELDQEVTGIDLIVGIEK
jgi:hypothetical protein